MLVHAVAQVELDAERHAPGDQPPRDGQRQAQHAGGEDGERQRRQARLVALADLVDGAAGEPRDGDRHDHRGGREQPRQDDAPAVGAQPAEQPHERRHRRSMLVDDLNDLPRPLDLRPRGVVAAARRPPARADTSGSGCRSARAARRGVKIEPRTRSATMR